MKTRTVLSAIGWAALMVTVGACDNNKGVDTGASETTGGTDGSLPGDSGTSGTQPTGDWSIVLSGPEQIQAGELAAYTITLTDPSGADASDEAELSLSADPGEMSTSGLSATATLPGDYTVTAAATLGGDRWETSLPLSVTAGDPESLSLAIDPSSVAAGSVVTATWSVTDAYGNALDPEVTLSSASPDLLVDGADLVTGLAGTYVVTAVVDGTAVFDTANLEVLPGAADALELVLDGYDAELGAGLGYDLLLFDAYGNPLDTAGVSVTASPADGVDISPGELIFNAEGFFDVTAAIDGLSDTEGPVTVDSNGPLILIDAPARGEYGSASQLFFEGSITDEVTGVVSATLDGNPLSLEKDGSFRDNVRMSPGTNLIEITATDADGNVSDVVLGSMYSADYLADGEPVADLVDIHVGPDGLDALAADAGDQIDLGVIEDGLMAANPVYDGSFDWACAYLSDAYLSVDITGLSYSDFAVGMTAGTNLLTVDVALTDLVIDVDGSYALCFGDSTLNSALTADTATVEVDLELEVNARGRIIATVVDTRVILDNFAADFDSLNTLVDILGTLGLDLEGQIQGILEDELTAAVQSELPGIVEDMLGLFEFEQTFDLVTATATMDAAPRAIELSTAGMTLVMEGEVSPDSTVGGLPEVPGSVLMVDSHPVYTGTPEIELALSADGINRVLHAAWEAGAFSITLGEADLGLDAKTIGVLFPGATTLELAVTPQMAPTVTPGTGAGMFDLAVGELTIDITGDVGGVSTWLATVSVHATGDFDVDVFDDGVDMVVDNLVTTFDVQVKDAADVAWAEDLEAVLDAFAGTLTSGLVPDVSFAVPAVSGISLVPTGVSVLGADLDWVGVQLNIE